MRDSKFHESLKNTNHFHPIRNSALNDRCSEEPVLTLAMRKEILADYLRDLSESDLKKQFSNLDSINKGFLMFCEVEKVLKRREGDLSVETLATLRTNVDPEGKDSINMEAYLNFMATRPYSMTNISFDSHEAKEALIKALDKFFGKDEQRN